MALTGFGQDFTFGTTEILNITGITVNDKGNVFGEVVADQPYQVRNVSPGQFGFMVNFLCPNTGVHTMENAIDSNTAGAVDCTSAGTKYTAASCFSGGYTKSAPSGGFVTFSLEVVVSGAVTKGVPV